MFQLQSFSENDALKAIQAALGQSMQATEDLQKTFTQSPSQLTGLTAFSLEAPAKTFVPVQTPIRNMLPRVTAGVGIQANWRAVTAYNNNNVSVGVSEGNRGQIQAVQVKEYMAAFRTIGIDSYVTEEAKLAAQGFDDVLARAVQANLAALMIAEEFLLIGGLGTFGLGQPTGLAVTAKTTNGALPNSTTYHVRVCALTLEGYRFVSGTLKTRGQLQRTTANGVTDTFGGGTSRASASVSATTGSATASLECTVTPVKGAVAYAWYVGADATTMYLQAVTTTNSWIMTAPTVTSDAEALLGADLIANDRSQNNLVFDGFFSQIAANGSGALWQQMPTGTIGKGTPLTSDGAGGIVEIDQVLEWFWTNHRISPTSMWVNAREMQAFRKKGLLGNSSSTQRFTFNTDQRNIVLSGKVRGYTNPYALSGSLEVPINLHPNVPPGTILFLTSELPYSMPGITDVARVLCRRDYYQINYPQTRRTYEYGVYSDELLQVYFPPANAVLTNIGTD